MRRIECMFITLIFCLSIFLFIPVSLAETSVEIEDSDLDFDFDFYFNHTSLEMGMWDQYKLREDLMQGGYENLCVYELEDNVYAFAELYQLEEEVISYLILGEDRALMWDTGMGIYDFREMAERITDLPLTVLVSHEHYDHICGNMYFDGVMCYNHPDVIEALSKGMTHEDYRSHLVLDEFVGILPEYVDPDTICTPGRPPVGVVEDGDIIDLGGRKLEVMNVQGHTDASIVLFDAENHILFPGDMFYLGPIYVAGEQETAIKVYAENMRKMTKHAEELGITHIYGSHNAIVEGLEDLQNITAFAEDIAEGKEEYIVLDEFGDDTHIYIYMPDPLYMIWFFHEELE